MKQFMGKKVYITGGSSGIGFATGKVLASKGADILLIARNIQKLKIAQKTIEGSRKQPQQQVKTLSVDVADYTDVCDKMNSMVETFGVPDILINSAGINKYANHFENIDYDMFNEVMDINVNGVRNVIHALIEPMKKKKSHVVILSSAAALFGMFGYTAYGTSKAALMGFAESLRYELKPLGMPVTVIFPPEVDTPMNLDEVKTLPAAGRAMKTLGGFLQPEYVANIIVKAIARKKYFVIPGLSTRFFYFLHRLSNGCLSRIVSDFVVKRTVKN